MNEYEPQPLYRFNKYPSPGSENWEYTFATAQVRALEDKLLDRALLQDMANAPDFNSAVEMLSGTDYNISTSQDSTEQIEQELIRHRAETRNLFRELIHDEEITALLSARADFANLRLALRRLVTEKPIGEDYSDEGTIPADRFEEVLQQEDYVEFPMYLREVIEAAILRYYEDKDIRNIDYAIDSVGMLHMLSVAREMQNDFLLELFRMRIDLTNIKTLMRLKFRETEIENVFIEHGYIDTGILRHAYDQSLESIPAIFANTPYHYILESAVSYFNQNNSFLKLEQLCESHLLSFLASTDQITAGPQPVIAYLLRKENEIRTLRMILTGKKNALKPQLMLDRLAYIEN